MLKGLLGTDTLMLIEAEKVGNEIKALYNFEEWKKGDGWRTCVCICIYMHVCVSARLCDRRQTGPNGGVPVTYASVFTVTPTRALAVG